MGATYSISPDVLRWVYQKALIGAPKSMSLLESWIAGAKIPTFNQIETVSRETRIPLGYFFLNNPPKENIPLLKFRTVNSERYSEPSRNLIDTIHDMEMIVDWMRRTLKDDDSEPCPVVGSCREARENSLIADYIREVLYLDLDWFGNYKNPEEAFKDIRERMNSIGVTVMQSGVVGNNTHRPLDAEEFRAFTIIDEYAPLIFINSTDSPRARLFSLFHEFAHVCIGIDSLYNVDNSSINDDNKIEVLCNAVAGNLLVPEILLRQKWNDNIEAEELIASLADYFKCSQVVIARKAYDISLINKEKYNEVSKNVEEHYLKNRKQADKGGGDYYATAKSRMDHRFLRMLMESVAKGKTQYSEACRLTHTNRVTLSNLTEERMSI